MNIENQIYVVFSLWAILLILLAILSAKVGDLSRRLDSTSNVAYDAHNRINGIYHRLPKPIVDKKDKHSGIKPGQIIRVDNVSDITEKKQIFWINLLCNGGARIYESENKARNGASSVKGGCYKVAVPVEV